MALIPCPECGKEISDQSPACIHCGYPLDPAQYSLVLTEKIPDSVKAIQLICEYLLIPEEEAKNLLLCAPCVLLKGQSYAYLESLAKQFEGIAELKILTDSDAEDPETLRSAPSIPPTAPPRQEEESKGMSFGGTVAAVIVGVVVAILLLSIL